MVSMQFERKSSWFATFHHFPHWFRGKFMFHHFPKVDKVAGIAPISCWFVIARWYFPLPNQQVPLIFNSPKWLQWFVIFAMVSSVIFHHYLKQTEEIPYSSWPVFSLQILVLDFRSFSYTFKSKSPTNWFWKFHLGMRAKKLPGYASG